MKCPHDDQECADCPRLYDDCDGSEEYQAKTIDGHIEEIPIPTN